MSGYLARCNWQRRTVNLEEKGQTVGHILGKFKGFGLSNPQLETFLRHEIERRDDV